MQFKLNSLLECNGKEIAFASFLNCTTLLRRFVLLELELRPSLIAWLRTGESCYSYF